MSAPKHEIIFPFKHHLLLVSPREATGWRLPHEFILLEPSPTNGYNRVVEEYVVRGDPVTRLCPVIETMEKRGPLAIWALRLSASPKDYCIVFAPADFDIVDFHHDLMSLFYFGTFASLALRSPLSEEYQYLAEMVSVKRTMGDAQGWWYPNQSVCVVCLRRDGAQGLWRYLQEKLHIIEDAVEINSLPGMEQVLLESMRLYQQHAARYPRPT